MVLGGPDYGVRAGHLFEGTIAVTGELFVTPMGLTIERAPNPAVGAATMQ